MRYKMFEQISPKTQLQINISEATQYKLIKLIDGYNQGIGENIIFTENYTRWRNIGPRCKSSLQRRLLASLFYDIADILEKDRLIIDVAGGGEYCTYMKFPKQNIFSLNISGNPAYLESAEDECLSVPKNHFDYATCINYMLLTKNPYKVMQNISNFLKTGGIAIIDFSSLIYWYLSGDGVHWHAYNPSFIEDLMTGNFSEFLIIPVGNCISALFNFYAKAYANHYVIKLLIFIGLRLGQFEHFPSNAIQYIVIAKK